MTDFKQIKLLKETLATSKKIAIIPHRNPDGDAIGSCLALWHVLKELNHEVTVIAPNEIPDFISWMPGVDEILYFEKQTDISKQILNDAEVIFTLDFNALHRTGDLMESYLSTLNKMYILIDHHQAPESYAEIVFSDVNYGSTCEFLYEILKESDLNKYLNKNSATCLYTGIVTDSGSFKFIKTTSNTHRIVADLIDLGVDNPNVHIALFNNNSANKLQLLGQALQNIRILPEQKTAYITLSQQELSRYHHKKGDTEGIVNYALSIKDINFAAIFIENKDEGIIKISFRSEGNIDVNEFARKYFNGGGHINAAGGKSFDNLEDTTKKFVEIIKETRND